MKWGFRWNPKPAQAAIAAAGMKAQLEAARYMVARATELAPVDTGFMVSTITLTSNGKEKNVRVEVEAPYATFVEFGHLTVSGGWVEANPFLRTALADTAKAFPEIAGNTKLDMGLGHKEADGDWAFYSNSGATFSNDT